ncbi:hypothetical protein RHI9324_05496 [Rhizobium sp. CECT 9324]|nr:hypothetical protein RHI9324_04039 [Rhizobium sp. CECT 9324]CAH0343758.1 hypothetical protein RHI9324_05496 [Rhizobium sp. CECT 9324]
MQSTALTIYKPPGLPALVNEAIFTATALGLVGTGRTPQDARRDLMEKIRQSGEQ